MIVPFPSFTPPTIDAPQVLTTALSVPIWVLALLEYPTNVTKKNVLGGDSPPSFGLEEEKKFSAMFSISHKIVIACASRWGLQFEEARTRTYRRVPVFVISNIYRAACAIERAVGDDRRAGQLIRYTPPALPSPHLLGLEILLHKNVLFFLNRKLSRGLKLFHHKKEALY